MSNATSGAVLVFDGDCGFCTTAARFLETRIRADVEAVAWQRADLGALGLTEQACRDAVQWVDPEGAVSSGGRAITAALLAGALPWPVVGWLGRLPGCAWLVERAYSVVAANRYRLPGGTPACRLPDRPPPVPGRNS